MIATYNKKTIQPTMHTPLKTTNLLFAKKDQIKSLIDFGIVMTFKYQNPSKKELYEFEIDPGKDLE
ncbi:hypothetical protein N9189_03895 [Pirellulaceae bacterium]|nr:hypothetical protein [Pirellulaceae bacterium]